MSGPGKGTVSSAEVARLAGVSRSAVSRTFTPNAYVSPGTRAKVEHAAEMLGYRPNMLARGLITRRTHMVGVVTTHLDNPFYALLLQSLMEELQRIDMATLSFIADETSNDELISRLLSYRVDGLILTNTSLSSRMAVRCAQGATPVIAIDRYIDADAITSVVCDNVSSAARVADLLVEGGWQRIAFIAGQPDTSSSRDRESGFRQQLAVRGRALWACAVGGYAYEGGAAAARQLLSAADRPDAIFCANDLMGLAVIDVATEEFGLTPGRDLAVVGFDNSAPASGRRYGLTSVDQNTAGMVGLAIGELQAAMAGQASAGRKVTIPGRLVLRLSTGHGEPC